jgi:predicted acetyltransferase
MNSRLPAGVEVLRATKDQETVLANLLEFYTYDFSELMDFPLDPNGRFGYPWLSLYWQEENRFPFLIWSEAAPIGFVLLTRGSSVDEDPNTWDMSEFFVVRGVRGRGIGKAVAHHIWQVFPGKWEVRVRGFNKPALTFWQKAVSAFLEAPAASAFVQKEEKRWQVFSFRSDSADAAAGGSAGA